MSLSAFKHDIVDVKPDAYTQQCQQDKEGNASFWCKFFSLLIHGDRIYHKTTCPPPPPT